MSSDFNYSAIMPEIIATGFGLLLMLLASTIGRQERGRLAVVAAVGVIVATAFALRQWNAPAMAFFATVVADNFSVFFRTILGAVVLLLIMSSVEFNRREGILQGEYAALLLFAYVGMSLMAASNDLILTFLSLEVLSIASFVLLGLKRWDARSNESSMKYFMLGSFSSAFFLYGIALLYGGTGSTKLTEISQALGGSPSLLAMVGLALMVVGLCFKVAVAPFHVWTPDVYEGAPTPVTTFMAVGPKLAGFAVLLRLLSSVGPWHWNDILWLLAIFTMTLGNVVALVQPNIKRMLACSSIAHAGYILVGLVAGTSLGLSAVLFYLLAYAFMKISAFSAVIALTGKGDGRVNMDDYAGLGFKHPLISVTLSLALLGLIGVPATSGFIGKLYLFTAALDAGYLGLVLIAVLNSALSVFYYVRPIVVMFMGQAEVEPLAVEASHALVLVMLISALLTLFLGLFPGKLLEVANLSAAALK